MVRTESERVYVTRREVGFDRACEEAYRLALSVFGCDEDGHFRKLKGFPRSTSCLVVEFVKFRHGGGMGGQELTYEFEAWVESCEDEE